MLVRDDKSTKFTSCCQVLTTYTEANSLQLVAYSMLDMRHQSFNLGITRLLAIEFRLLYSLA